MEYELSTKIDNLKERVGETFKENIRNERVILTNIKKKRALITGITGQDGSYLAEFLLGKGYEVYGMHRRTSMDVFERIGDLRREIKLVEGDVTDQGSIIRIINEIHPKSYCFIIIEIGILSYYSKSVPIFQ